MNGDVLLLSAAGVLMTDSRDGLFLIRDEGFNSSTENETEKLTGVTDAEQQQQQKNPSKTKMEVD